MINSSFHDLAEPSHAGDFAMICVRSSELAMSGMKWRHTFREMSLARYESSRLSKNFLGKKRWARKCAFMENSFFFLSEPHSPFHQGIANDIWTYFWIYVDWNIRKYPNTINWSTLICLIFSCIFFLIAENKFEKEFLIN